MLFAGCQQEESLSLAGRARPVPSTYRAHDFCPEPESVTTSFLENARDIESVDNVSNRRSAWLPAVSKNGHAIGVGTLLNTV